MKNVLIINGHQPYPFAEGRLNGTLVDRARTHLEANGYEVEVTEVANGWDVETELGRHRWAHAVLMQFPINWMSTPWVLKQYMDEVYTAGMDGRLCAGDGRHGPGENHKYGLGGSLAGTRYSSRSPSTRLPTRSRTRRLPSSRDARSTIYSGRCTST